MLKCLQLVRNWLLKFCDLKNFNYLLQMFSDDAVVRSEARDFLSKGQRPPVVFINRKEVVDKLSQVREIKTRSLVKICFCVLLNNIPFRLHYSPERP